MICDFVHPLAPASLVAVYAADEVEPDEPTHHLQTVALAAAALPFALRRWHWRPQLPIVVFSGREAGILTESQRDQVWGLWGMPVLEQLLDSGSRVIAEECDAREGFHLRTEGLSQGQPLAQRCPCGLLSARADRSAILDAATAAAMPSAG